MRRVVLAFLTVLALAPATASAQDFEAPDIEMQAPYGVVLTTDGAGRSYVAFSSKVINKGPGALKVVGERASTVDPRMVATQILLDNGSVRTGKPAAVKQVGEFEFSPSADHDHWHFLRFEDYNLLSVPGLDHVAPTRKTGFCLLGLDLAFWCGHQMPDLLSIGGPLDYDANSSNPDTRAMGMVAEGSGETADPGEPQNRSSEDEYIATVEGQDIEITNVPNGRYCLSFEVNPTRAVIEARYANNGASRMIDIGGTPGGTREIDLVAGSSMKASATCGLAPTVEDPDPGTGTPGGPTTPGTPGGPTPGNPGGPSTGDPDTPPSVVLVTFTSSRSSRLALRAVKKAFTRPSSVARSCRVSKVTKATCRVALKQGGARYSGTVTVSQRLRSGSAYWFYAVSMKRTRVGSCERSRVCPRRVKTRWLLGGALGSNSAAARRALALPSGPAVPVQPGVAWPDSALPPDSRRQVRAYKPVGR